MQPQFDQERAARESLDRIRRIETRVTRVANHLGVDSGNAKPEFRDGNLHVASKKCSIDELLNAIPDSHIDEEVDVYQGDDQLMVVIRTV